MELEEKYRTIKLTTNVITTLGFGDYWGESGDFGKRMISDPDRPNYGCMVIYDMDEMAPGNYGGYQEPGTPQHFVTSKFEYLYTVEDLIKDAELNWPKAVPILLENLSKINQGESPERSVAENPQ